MSQPPQAPPLTQQPPAVLSASTIPDVVPSVPVPSKQTSYQQVVEAHRRLNKQMDEMTQRIGTVVQRNQSQFLLAYQNHIRKIRIELMEMRNRTDEHEKQIKKNDQVTLLEKQVTVFREEALRLYERLDDKTQEAQLYKSRVRELEKDFLIAQKEVKEHMKQKKLLQSKYIQTQAKLAYYQQHFQFNPITPPTPTPQQQSSSSITNNNYNYNNSYYNNKQRLPKQLSQTRKQSLTTKARNTLSLGLGLKKRKSVHIGGTLMHLGGNADWERDRQRGRQGEKRRNYDGELKDWFLDCVRSIKRDVAQRKNSGEQTNFDYVASIEDFKMVDKLKLLQKFMQNQKLLIWLYQKMFPNRQAQIKAYLSTETQPQPQSPASSQKKSHMRPSQKMSQTQYIHKTTNAHNIGKDILDEFEYEGESEQVENMRRERGREREREKERERERKNNIGSMQMEVNLPKMGEGKSGRKGEIRNRVAIKDGRLNMTMF